MFSRRLGSTGDPLFTNQAAIELSSKFWLSIYS